MAELIILLGPTGAGKSVQAALFAQRHHAGHVSSGELLRQDPAMKKLLETGALADPQDVNKIIAQAITDMPANQLVVVDGFPRMLEQAKWLDSQLTQWGRTLTHAVFIDVDEATTRQRLSTRGRSDDTPQAQTEKWRRYKEVTMPVIDYYHRQGKLTRVNGMAGINEVAAEIEEALS